MYKSMFTFGMLYTVIAFVGGIYGCSKQPFQLPAKPVVEQIKVPPPQEIPPGMEKALEFKIQPDGSVRPEETFVPIKKAEEKIEEPAEPLTFTVQPDGKIAVQEKALVRYLSYNQRNVNKARDKLEKAQEVIESAQTLLEQPADALEAVVMAKLEQVFELEAEISERSKALLEKVQALQQEAEKSERAMSALLKKLKEAQDRHKTSPWDIGRPGSPMF